MGVKGYLPPHADEVEISIFGPGFGECILVHLGLGDWISIDSCTDPKTGAAVAISYLEAIKTDPASALRIVLSTHWDDDHISGLAQLFGTARSAKFVCSSAMSSREFEAVLGSWLPNKFLPGGSGVDEIDQVLRELNRRSKDTSFPMPVTASENKVIWERASAPAVEVRALSPSDTAHVAAIARFTQLVSGNAQIRRRLPRILDNMTSVVLSMRIENIRLLLGGDLLCREDRAVGWLAVVDCCAGGHLHSAYKIPHHGSENADHDEIWSRLLSPNPFSFTTPIVTGSVRLPTTDDCRRILRRTDNAYVTAPPVAGRYRDRDRTVDKMMRRFARQVQLAPGDFGHIRLRRSISANDNQWNVELFGDAVHLQRML